MSVDLIEAAKAAITEVFSNITVSRRETKEELEELADFIQDMLNTLDE